MFLLRINFKTLLFLAGIILLSLYLRLTGIEKGGLWIDEIASFTAALKSFPFGTIEHLKLYDNHGPLYILLLNLWMKVFGSEEIILRVLSVLFGVASILTGFWVGKNFFNIRTGVIIAFLTCINSTMIYYSQEIRSYSLVVFLCFCSLYCFLSLTRNFTVKNNIYLAIINVLILYTSPFGIIFVLLELLALFIYLITNKSRDLLSLIKWQSLTAVLFTPYLPIWFHQSGIYGNRFFLSLWGKDNLFDTPYQVLLNLLTPFAFIKTDISEALGSNFFYVFFTLFVIIPIFISILGIINSISSKNKNILFVVSIAASFCIVLLAMHFFKNLPLNTRYFIFICPFLITVVSYGLAELKPRKLSAVIVSIFVFINLLYLAIIPFSAQNQSRNVSFYNEVSSYLNQKQADILDSFIILPYGATLESAYYKKLGINSNLVNFDLLYSLPRKDPEIINLFFTENFLASTENLNSKTLHKDLRDYYYAQIYSEPGLLQNYDKFGGYIETAILPELKEKKRLFIAVKKYFLFTDRDKENFRNNKQDFYDLHIWKVLYEQTRLSFLEYFSSNYRLLDRYETETTLIKVYEIKEKQST